MVHPEVFGKSISSSGVKYVGRIPVRNLWLLMLYASEMFRQIEGSKIKVEENPDEIPDLVAEILTYFVERHLKRNLFFGYRSKEKVLSRVRGRINIIKTERKRLLERGLVSCNFEELTVNTPRNRFVRSALVELAKVVNRSELAQKCRFLASSFRRMGVTGEKPTRIELSKEQFGRHDTDEKKCLLLLSLRLIWPFLPKNPEANPSPFLKEKWIG